MPSTGRRARSGVGVLRPSTSPSPRPSEGAIKRLRLAALCAWVVAVVAPGTALGACPETCSCASTLEAQCRGAGGDVRLLVAALDARVEDLEVTGVASRVLHTTLWRALPRLRRLSFDGNGVQTVEDGAFQGLSGLQELSLSSNLLQRLPPRLLEYKSALDRLFLSRNPLYLSGDEPFLYVPSLRWLQLDDCGLTQVPEQTFRGFPNLRVLQMRDNSLKTLGNAVVSLTHLSVLALQGNSFVRQVFLLPPNLLLLNLNDNDVGVCDQGMFEYAHNLEYLMISNNFITLVHTGSLLYLHKLKYLELGGNKLNNSFQTLSSDASIELAHLENLSSLKLHENDIEVLNLKVFQELKNLTDLSLSGNQIRTITNENWHAGPNIQPEKTPKLETLSLSENKINFLGSSLRPFMVSLLNLNLSSNRLVSFSSSRLTQETRSTLKILDLSHNRINPSYAKTLELDYLTNLEYLSLLCNNIESMSENTFRRLKRLKHLDLSVNKFKSLPQNLFRNLKELKILYLKYLNMNDGMQDWPQDLFIPLVNLEILSLMGNNLRNMSGELFVNMKYLKDLDLSYNNFQTLNLDILTNSINLQHLNLEYNSLLYLSCDSACSFISVTNLNLESNSFKQIPQNFSKTFPSLQRLDVSRNLLVTLDLDALESLDSLSFVRASYNPVPCDCIMRAAWQRYGGAGNQTVEATCQVGTNKKTM